MNNQLRNTPPFLLFAASVCLLIASCGLPQLIFLAPPTTVSISDEAPPAILFSHDTANANDSFRGYGIYYKFYDNATNNGGCRTDRDYITGTPITLTPTRLQERGYRQVIFNDMGSNRIIQVSDKSIASRLSINIPDPTRSNLIATILMTGSSAVNMYRDIQNTSDNNSEYKPFYANPSTIFVTNDADLQGISDPVAVLNAGNLYIAFYGIARGFDTSSFQALYSEPKFLGYLSMSASAGARSQQCNDGL